VKAIILAGGAGSRLYPLTNVITKQLQPVYDKPMIYYPISFLMNAQIKDILIISTKEDGPSFKKFLGDGKKLGISIQYKIQEKPTGIPQAFIIGEDFIGNEDIVLLLGDNIFYGDNSFFIKAIDSHEVKANGVHARVFAYAVSDPERYGVVEFDRKTGGVLSIEEKPEKPRSKFAIPGLYLFDNSVINRTKKLRPSNRRETEITDLIESYFKEGKLGVEIIERGIAWLDAGTPKSLLEASSFISAIEQRQGLKVACLEEMAFRNKFINFKQFNELVETLPKCPYREYLEEIIEDLKYEY